MECWRRLLNALMAVWDEATQVLSPGRKGSSSLLFNACALSELRKQLADIEAALPVQE
jgi:hypothetical protein